MTLTDLVIVILCTNALVELLRHDTRLSDLRILWQTSPDFWSRVLRCGFCSSFWAAFVTTFVLVGPRVVFPEYRVTLLPYLLAAGLAAARAAQLLNDRAHSFSRSPTRPEDAQ